MMVLFHSNVDTADFKNMEMRDKGNWSHQPSLWPSTLPLFSLMLCAREWVKQRVNSLFECFLLCRHLTPELHRDCYVSGKLSTTKMAFIWGKRKHDKSTWFWRLGDGFLQERRENIDINLPCANNEQSFFGRLADLTSKQIPANQYHNTEHPFALCFHVDDIRKFTSAFNVTTCNSAPRWPTMG